MQSRCPLLYTLAEMSENSKEAIRSTYWSIAGGAGLAIIKFAAGIFGNSYALIADGIESLSDMFSSFLVLLGLRYASRPPDDNHPYGHGKAEPLAVFAVVGFLIGSAVLILYQGILNILTPHELPKPFTIWVLVLIILVKEFFYRRMKHKSRLTHSSALEADAWHHRSDAITSLAALLGIALAIWMGEGWEAADDWAALLAALVILYNAYRIFRPALSEIMDEHRYDDMVEEIRELSAEVGGVVDTEKCYIRKMGMSFHVDLHLVVNGAITVKEGHDIAHRVKYHLQEKLPRISDVHIHVEPDASVL